MKPVDVVHWNPREGLFPGPIGRRLPFGSRKRNFGDMLGPEVVRLVKARAAISPDAARPGVRLLTVGSIMHLARDGDTVWGTGVNGKGRVEDHQFKALDVRAVRGPKTREFLGRLGVDAPAVFGDPALLLPMLHPQLRAWSLQKRHNLAVVPNLNELEKYRSHTDFVDPQGDLDACLKRIAQSELVVGSSLHAIIVAESLGIPARLIVSAVEPSFKYDDYFGGTGRDPQARYPDVATALKDSRDYDAMVWDQQPLLQAFPADLWKSASPRQ